MSKRTKKTSKPIVKFDETEFRKISIKQNLPIEDVKRIHKEFEVYIHIFN